MNFGEKLIRLRKIKSITQDELAAIIGVSRQAVYKWESGKSYPEVNKLLEIKNLFNISIDDLLDESFEIELPKKKRKKRLSAEKKREIELQIEKELSYSTALSEPEVHTSQNEETASNSQILSDIKEEQAEEKINEPITEEIIPVKEKRIGLFGRLFGKK